MYKIYFYKDKHGRQPVLEYLQYLSGRRDKDSRIKLNKINDYIEALSRYGTVVGEPYIKHLEGSLWELRPLRDRIFFVSWQDNAFVLLHYFMKKTEKTPVRELEQARRELTELQQRGLDDVQE